MKNNYQIGSAPLTIDFFSKKYWLDGDAKFQYHTMDIEDGRTETEQLLINNDRALFDRYSNLNAELREVIEEIGKAYRDRKKTGIVIAFLTGIAITIGIASFTCKRMNQQH